VRLDTRNFTPHFQTTQWSVIRQAIGNDESKARQGMAAICNAYWQPLYTYLRRAGNKPHDAEDLVQGFFEHFIKNNILAATDPSKGKLRHFLLACLRNHASNARDKAAAQKRGADLVTSFDAAVAEDYYQSTEGNEISPDRLFQREWALTMLGQAMEALQTEFSNAGKGTLFDALRPFLGFGPDPVDRYDEISATIGIPVGTLKSHVHRMRERWKALLFETVGNTLDNPTEEEIREELRDLQGYV
jgi:RNA polymerase sigma-70 factor (ECF subfamily)